MRNTDNIWLEGRDHLMRAEDIIKYRFKKKA
jgi:hypothetical protein